MGWGGFVLGKWVWTYVLIGDGILLREFIWYEEKVNLLIIFI